MVLVFLSDDENLFVREITGNKRTVLEMTIIHKIESIVVTSG